MSDLFSPVRMGAIEVNNRIFMAPLTRNRADDDTDIPSDLAIEYYRQRASAGLIIAEGTQISAMGKGYIRTPGIYTDRQANQWRKITDAVHKEGGRIFLQLWHVGRISHPSVLPEGRKALAPSAITAHAQTFVDGEMKDVSEPAAMTIEDIEKTLAEYRLAAECAKHAQFDGVEIHGANGYLIDQFLRDGSNKRDDAYGGSAQARVLFLQQVIESVLYEWPADRIGVRLSPTGTFNDAHDSNPLATFSQAIDVLNDHKLAYLHVVEQFPGAQLEAQEREILRQLRSQWQGFYIANGGYDQPTANKAIASGYADAVSFGQLFLANPDLPKRFKLNAPLNEPNPDTFYGGGAEGYTDYPFLSNHTKNVRTG